MADSIFFIFIAFALYTVVIFSERKHGWLEKWMYFLFFLGFTFDIVGTGYMFLGISNGNLAVRIHIVFGYVALLIMFIHLAWATLAIKGIWKWERYFTRFSIYAWGLWTLALTTGGMTRFFC